MPSIARVVDADVNTIWAWLTTPERMQLWMSNVDALRSADGEPLKTGTRLLFNARGREHESVVAELVAHRYLLLRSVQGPVSADYAYYLEARGSRCEVTLDVRCRGRGLIRLLMPVIRSAMWLTDRSQLSALQAAVGNAVHDYRHRER